MLADGPGSFALGVDRNADIMRERPRPLKGPLLDRASWTFVLGAALLRTLVAFGILLALPRMGYSILETQTAIFAFEYLGQVLIAYPSRRVGARPQRSWALHAATLAGLAVVALLLAWAPARAMLGLTPLDPLVLSLVVAASVAGWLIGEATARYARATSRREATPA
jgi:magnesium-transporting ATPase (P-type)